MVRISSNPFHQNTVQIVRYFFLYRRFHDFIVSLLCNANPCGLTLRYASKFARFAFTEAFRLISARTYLNHKKTS